MKDASVAVEVLFSSCNLFVRFDVCLSSKPPTISSSTQSVKSFQALNILLNFESSAIDKNDDMPTEIRTKPHR